MTQLQAATALVSYINARAELYAQVTLAPLSEGNDIGAQLLSGTQKTTYLGLNSVQSLRVMLLLRHDNQQTAITAAGAIVAAISAQEELPEGIEAVYPYALPSIVDYNGRDYLYSVVLNVDYYCEKEQL